MMYENPMQYQPYGWRQRLWARMRRWLSADYELKRRLTFVAILVVALVAFEIFNFSTTDFALTDLLGDARFVGIRWATILALAFCGIDFAGLARLFTPGGTHNPSLEVWYLLGAWFLGATLNAMMTWWAVSLAMVDHAIGNEILTREELLTYVPIFIATMVWLTRMLIIGTFSVAGDRLFINAETLVDNLQKEDAREMAQNASLPPQGGRLPRTNTNVKPKYQPRPSRQPVRTAAPRQTNRPANRRNAPSNQPRRPNPPRRQPPPPPAKDEVPELEYEDLDTPNPTIIGGSGRTNYQRTNGNGLRRKNGWAK